MTRDSQGDDRLPVGQRAGRSEVQRLLEQAFEQRTPLLATLARQFRDLELAEDALQDAFEQALEQWPENPPLNPLAWLLTASRRRALDQAIAAAAMIPGARNGHVEVRPLIEFDG